MIHFFKVIRKRKLNENKILQFFLYAIGEIVLIVLGILIALYLQNRNDEVKAKNIVDTTISMLKDEILSNKAKIDLVKEYHIMVKDTLEKMEIPKSEQEANKALGFWRGMNTPRLQDAAFQTSIQSGVGREIDPEVLKTLNNLYTYQESYNNFTTQSTQIFFNTDFSDFKSVKRMMSSIQITMNDLYYYEKALLKFYQDNLVKIDSVYSPE